MKHVMHEVESSQIESVGYDQEKRELFVKFKSGGTYRYFGVAPERHAALMKADSVGAYLSAHIKSKYSFKKA